MNKDSFRAMTLGSRLGKRETVESRIVDGLKADVVTLTVGERARMLAGCTNGDGKVDQGKLIPALLIATLREVGSEDRIFTEGDLDALAQLSAPVADEFAGVALRLNGLDAGAEERAAKN